MAKDPTDRALALLSLFQSRRWSATELAERFDVTERTIRRDVDRLRALGYPVDATLGRAGGYRLAVGSHLPPLMFDDDEAVALVIGLRAAAGAAIAGVEDASLRTLVKVEHSLPDRLRRRVAALEANTVSLQRAVGDTSVVDPGVLATLAAACRDGEEVRFAYRRRDGEEERRLVEPHQMVSAGRLWYLVAWDVRRSDWRTFRLDRMNDARLAGRRFRPRPIPGGDAAAYLTTSVGALPRPVEAEVVVGASLERLAPTLARVDHEVVDADPNQSTIRLRGARLESVVLDLVRLALLAEVTVIDAAPELGDRVAALASRLSS